MCQNSSCVCILYCLLQQLYIWMSLMIPMTVHKYRPSLLTRDKEILGMNNTKLSVGDKFVEEAVILHVEPDLFSSTRPRGEALPRCWIISSLFLCVPRPGGSKSTWSG